MDREIHQNTGLENGRLNPCPNSPNCIGSMYAEDAAHFSAPWVYTCTRKEAMEALVSMMQEEAHTSILVNTNEYLHISVTIPVFKFVDDVEFYLPEGTQQIHFRSASRVGYSDLGANARRMRRFKKCLEEKLETGL